MRSNWLLFSASVILSASLAIDAAAKPRQWQDATLVGAGGLSGSGVGVVQGLYMIKTEKITYVIPNYSKRAVVERWLVLPADGHVKISIAGSKIHILDADGKDREVHLVWKIITKP